MSDFTHLNVHSCFSLMRAVPWPAELCAAARKAGQKTLALTDTDGLYGLIEFFHAAVEHGVQPLVGAQLTDRRTKAKAVVLVRERETGYPALCELISRRHLDDGFSLAEALGELNGQMGSLAVLTADRSLLTPLAGLDNLFCEIKSPVGSVALSRWAAGRKIPCVVTGEVHLLTPEQHPLHRLLRAVDTNTTLDQLPESETAPPSAWLKPEEVLRQELPHLPEAFERTADLAASCARDWSFGRLIFPRLVKDGGEESARKLRQMCEAGIARRYGGETAKVRRRLEKELEIIIKKGFADIFLIVADIVGQAPITCGRGSAAASLVSYLLAITHVDPVAHDLFFERFLNEQRLDPPDIDIDFPWDQRDDVLNYVFRTYGESKAAMVANHVGFRSAAALREIAKVHGLPDEEIGRVTKRLRGLWYSHKGDTARLLQDHPLFTDLDLGEPWPEIIRTAHLLEGRPRYLSVHCGGVVLVPDGIRRHAPVQKTPKGLPVLQWEKDQTEDAGLLKIDLLGNRSLAVIRDALVAVNRRYGLDLSYTTLSPLDDSKTRQLIARGDTVGVFYVESPAMRQLQVKTGKGDFEHLVIHSSIIRPAANAYIREYVRRLRGGEYRPLHPLLGEILAETFGIMVYQEDVSKVAMALAGFDAAAADALRKIISKKSRRRLLEYRERFFTGAAGRGVSEETAGQVWDMIMSFSGYSFCKPHSASYALVSFKSAWLKAHYPAQFMAAVISNQGGFYSTFAYLSECRRLGLRVLPPCINASLRAYDGDADWVRVGLMQIKGLSGAAVEALLDGRRERPYRNLDDFLRRVDIDPSDVRLLIKAGCFDAVAGDSTRPELMWRTHQWAADKAPKGRGQPLLPGLFDNPEAASKPGLSGSRIDSDESVPEYSRATMLRHEVQTLGFLASRHPLTLYREKLKKVRRILAKDLLSHAGRNVTLVGWYVTGKVVSAKTGDPMEFISFEDTSALFDTVLFPRAYARFCHQITRVRPYVLTGEVIEEFGAATLNVKQVSLL